MAIDNTGPARDHARLNVAECSHRAKRDEGRFSWCEDCGKQLVREALPRRTGKTNKQRKGSSNND